MRKLSQIIMIYLSFLAGVHAQTSQVSSPVSLGVGDQVPDVFIPAIRNYKAGQANMSDFRGKLVILDFWAVDCSPCLKAFPALEGLQKKFGDQIQVILVNKLSGKEIDSLYAKKRVHSALHRSFPDLPMVTSDTLLNALFRHRLIPHYVWIDGDRKVRAITGSDQVTPENVRAMLQDTYFTLPEKSDFLSFDSRKATLPQLYRSHPNHLIYYSSLIKYVPGLGGGQHRIITDTADQTVRISRTGPILQLYADALTQSRARGNPFEGSYFDFGKRVILEITDSARFFWNGKQPEKAWRSEHWFHYELVIPITSPKEIYQYYLADLDRFFRLRGRIEKRTLPCMVLVRISDKDKIKYQGDPLTIQTARSYTDSAGVYHLAGSSLETFRRIISEANRDKPFVVINDTGYEGLVSLKIQNPLSDIPALRKELREKYDLDLVATRHEVEIMIITED